MSEKENKIPSSDSSRIPSHIQSTAHPDIRGGQTVPKAIRTPPPPPSSSGKPPKK